MSPCKSETHASDSALVSIHSQIAYSSYRRPARHPNPPLLMDHQHTWPAPSDAARFSARFSARLLSKPQKFRSTTTSKTQNSKRLPDFPINLSCRSPPDFSALPFDLLTRVAASFTVPNLWSASMVCRSWRDALRPLREAMVLLRWGKRFKHGHGGVRQNLEKALDSFLKGAARGSTAAMVDAGLLYWEMGEKEKGIELYEKAAALGDPAGQCNLGISYLQAEPPKAEEAVQLFRRAAIAGHVRAQYNLALCLHQGRGLESNLAKAAKWYLRAAEGGNERAMYNTSLCYSSGEGLMRSDRQARKWMKRAADYGHSKAQYEYGLRLFSAGEMIKALVYLELATRAGETAAAHVKNAVVQRLSPNSQTRAMVSADNWRSLRSSR